MIIAMDKVDSVKVTIDKLIEQGQSLFTDITETAQDRARLSTLVDQHERTIEKMNDDVQQLRQQVADLERQKARLTEDMIQLESQLADANARLETIREASSNDTLPIRRDNGGAPENLTTLVRRAAHAK